MTPKICWFIVHSPSFAVKLARSLPGDQGFNESQFFQEYVVGYVLSSSQPPNSQLCRLV